MSAKLIQNPDGANFQARAVLEMVRGFLGSGIESSWNAEYHQYDADVQFTRFDNCREQGYVVFLRDKTFGHQINITFYEHRNSDQIYVQVNNKRTFNAPILDDITETWKDKWDCAFEAKFGEVMRVARFVVDQLEAFWAKHSPKVEGQAS